MVGGTAALGFVEENWDEVLRLAGSVRAGTVPPSVILKEDCGLSAPERP